MKKLLIISALFLFTVGKSQPKKDDLATANAGNAAAALVWAKTNRSATVEFYDDAGNYVSTL